VGVKSEIEGQDDENGREGREATCLEANMSRLAGEILAEDERGGLAFPILPPSPRGIGGD